VTRPVHYLDLTTGAPACAPPTELGFGALRVKDDPTTTDPNYVTCPQCRAFLNTLEGLDKIVKFTAEGM
jgi:hypothetical protein